MNEMLGSWPGFFPYSLAAWLRRLHLVARRALEGGAGGRFASLFRGAGVTFEELREYQPGDDIRAIEWKATARLGFPFVKRFVEERELSVVIAVDKSGSMAFGGDTRSKWQTAVEMAAILALLAGYNRDRVGVAWFDAKVRQYIPPRRGLKQILREVALMLLQRPEQQPTSLAQVCRFLLSVPRRHSLVLLISDFLDRDYQADFYRLARRHDVVAVRVVDVAETRLPPRGRFLLQDAEGSARLWFDATNSKLRQHWLQAANSFAEQLQATVIAAQADLWTIRTDEDLLASLEHWLVQRERRARWTQSQPTALTGLMRPSMA